MALTIAFARQPHVENDKRAVTVDVTFDSSYPTGGEVVTPAQLGLVSIDEIRCGAAVDPDTADNALLVSYDAANKKIQCFWSPTDSAAAGPLVEVPDTTNIAAYTARLVAVGY